LHSRSCGDLHLSVFTIAQANNLDALKKEALAKVEAQQQLVQQMVDQIFSYESWDSGSLRTSKIHWHPGEKRLQGWRRRAGIPTGGAATYGSGKPVIGFITDIDCIRGSSQKPGAGVSRSDHRRSAGTRRRPQLRHGGKRDGGAGSQTADGGAQDSRTLKVFPESPKNCWERKPFLIRAGLFQRR